LSSFLHILQNESLHKTIEMQQARVLATIGFIAIWQINCAAGGSIETNEIEDTEDAINIPEKNRGVPFMPTSLFRSTTAAAPAAEAATTTESTRQPEEEENGSYSYSLDAPNGPANWGLISPESATCDGRSQSPVNIIERRSTFAESESPLVIGGFDLKPDVVVVENSGHAAQLQFVYPGNQRVNFTGGALRVTYILDNVHWHWGETDRVGSEHSVNYRKYSAEAHFVLYNSDYCKSNAAIFT